MKPYPWQKIDRNFYPSLGQFVSFLCMTMCPRTKARFTWLPLIFQRLHNFPDQFRVRVSVETGFQKYCLSVRPNIMFVLSQPVYHEFCTKVDNQNFSLKNLGEISQCRTVLEVLVWPT